MATQNIVDFRSVSKGDLRKEYRKLNGIDAKLFYHNILIALKKAISDDDTRQFRKYAELLDIINKTDDESGLKRFYDVDCPIYRTNALLLACEQKAFKVFQLIVSNYCNILNLTKIPISPCDENNEGKNAYYYLIRTSNVELLKNLIDKWSFEIEPDKLDGALSKAYLKLIIQNVSITDDMKYFVEYTLNKIRLTCCTFGNPGKTKCNLKDVKRRSYIVIDSIKTLIKDYSDCEKSKVDEKFIYILKFVTLNLNQLKRMLANTYDRLPWDEMEFCLVMYLKTLRCNKEYSIYYRTFLSRDNVLKYLDTFCCEFENVLNTLKDGEVGNVNRGSLDRRKIINEISDKNKVFKELYDTFAKIRDFYSLEKIVYYLEQMNSENEEKIKANIDIFATKTARCLQILFEMTQNLSSELCRMITESYSENLEKMINDMKNTLLQKYSLRRHLGLNMNYEYFNKIKNDLMNVYCLVKDLLTRLQLENLEEILDHILRGQQLDKPQTIFDIFNYGKVEVPSLENVLNIQDEYSEIKQNISNLETELQAKDNTLKLLFSGLHNIIKENQETLTINNKDKYTKMYSILSMVLDVMKDCDSKDITNKNWNQILERYSVKLETFQKSKEMKLLDKQRFFDLIEQIVHHAELTSSQFNVTRVDYIKHRIYHLLQINDHSNNYNEDDTHTRNSRLPFPKFKNNLYVREILKSRIDTLKMIFKNYNVTNDPGSIRTFVKVYGKNEIFIIIEIILFDILSICEDNLLNNVELYDNHVPIVLGKELREYLARDTSVVQLLDSNVKLSIVMSCLAFMNESINLKNSKIKKEIISLNEIEMNFQDNIVLIEQKQKLFELLKNDKLNLTKLRSSVDFLSRNLNGFTTLHVAMKNQNVDIFKYCYTEIGSKNMLTDQNNTYEQNVLHVGSFCNNLQLIKYLFSSYSDVMNDVIDVPDFNQRTPIHYASAFGNPATLEYLIQQNPYCIHIQDGQFKTAIHTAIHFGNIETFSYLINIESDIRKNNNLPEGFNLLHLTAKYGNEAFAKRVLDRDADVDRLTAKGWTPLHVACLYGSFNVVKVLVENGAKVNAEIPEDKRTPLYLAIENSHSDIVKYLLKNGAHTKTIETLASNSLLHIAAIAGCSDVIEDLINHGADVNAVSRKQETPIHLATKHNSLEIVRILLQFNADVNCVDELNYTALHYAAESSNAEIFGLLLKYFANIKISDNVHHRTPIQAALISGQTLMVQHMIDFNIYFFVEENWKYAVQSGNVKIVEIVLKNCIQNNGCKNKRKFNELLPIAIQMKNNDVAKYLIKNGADINYVYDEKLNLKPLHFAIFTLNLEIAKLIIEKYIEVNDTSECFETFVNYFSILMYRGNQEEIFYDIVKLFITNSNMNIYGQKLLQHCIANSDVKSLELLLKNGIQPSYRTVAQTAIRKNSEIFKLLLEKSQIDGNSKEIYNITLFHLAANNCNSAIIKHFIEMGFDVNDKDDTNYAPIDYATMAGRGDTVELLLENGAKINKSLNIAMESDFVDIAHLLLKYGADVNLIVTESSPLHNAVRYGSQGCIGLLLENEKINVKACGFKKSTALHIAGHVGNLEATKVLIESGSDVHAVDMDNFKPVHKAIQYNHIEILKHYIDNNHISINEKTPDGRSLLHYAAQCNSFNAVRYLVEKKVDINTKDVNNESPIHAAAQNATKDVCEAILNAGASYNSPDKLGRWPYHLSNKKMHLYLNLINTLFRYVHNNDNFNLISFIESNQNELNLNALNEDGKSALHIAILLGHTEIINTLLKFNVNLNTTDFELNTPLHYASKLNNIKLVEDLIQNGAIYCIRNIQNLVPCDLSSSKEIKNWLITIDKSFKFAGESNTKFLTFMRSVKSHDDLKKILFGPRNLANETLYTFISENNLTDIREKIENTLNKDTASQLKKAKLLTQVGKYNESFNILNKLSIKYENMYGPYNPLTLNVQSELISVLYKLGEYEDCLTLNEKIVMEMLKNYDRKDQNLLKLRNYSGLLLHKLGRLEGALNAYQEVCRDQIEVFGFINDEVLNTKWHIGLVLLEMGRCNDALLLNQEIYETYKELYGEDNQLTVFIASNIAMVYHSMKEYSHSLKYYKHVSKKFTNIFGINHPFTQRSLRYIAKVLLQLNRYEEGISQLKSLHELQVLVLGEFHDETIETKMELSNVMSEHSFLMD